VNGLWELVEYHQRQCDHTKIRKWVEELLAVFPCASQRARESILQAAGFDAHLRRQAAERTKTDPALFDFLFGRPLIQTLKAYRLTIEHGPHGPVLRSLA
jgi:hypothetical protein